MTTDALFRLKFPFTGKHNARVSCRITDPFDPMAGKYKVEYVKVYNLDNINTAVDLVLHYNTNGIEHTLMSVHLHHKDTFQTSHFTTPIIEHNTFGSLQLQLRSVVDSSPNLLDSIEAYVEVGLTPYRDTA